MLSFANAKINLGLFLTEKRKDGFHNLETLFYPVRIYDVIELLDAAETSFTTAGLEIPGNHEDNLCLKVFHFMQKMHHLPNQKIVLLKNIPVGAGLGGGSADAAFLIKLINEKFTLNLPEVTLEEYAGRFGSDCTFFIKNKPCYAFEKGNCLENIPFSSLSPYYLVLVKPPIHVSTAEAYSAVEVKKPEISLKELIHLPLTEWKAQIKNDFEPGIFSKYPQIAKLKEELYKAGAIFSSMSGSGSSVYGIFDTKVVLPQLEAENKIFYGI